MFELAFMRHKSVGKILSKKSGLDNFFLENYLQKTGGNNDLGRSFLTDRFFFLIPQII